MMNRVGTKNMHNQVPILSSLSTSFFPESMQVMNIHPTNQIAPTFPYVRSIARRLSLSLNFTHRHFLQILMEHCRYLYSTSSQRRLPSVLKREITSQMKKRHL